MPLLFSLSLLSGACALENRETKNQDYLPRLSKVYPQYVIERADTARMDSSHDWLHHLRDIGITQVQFDSLLQDIASNTQQAGTFAAEVVAILEAEKEKERQESDSLKKRISVSDVDTVSAPRNKDN